MGDVLALRAVAVRYDTPHGVVAALDGIDADFAAATSTAIVGRSGSGKSTLLSVLALLRTPTSGAVLVDDVDVASAAEHERARLRSSHVGLVFQSFHLERSLTAAHNVMLPWVFDSRQLSRRAARLRAAELLELVGIGELSKRRPFEMSGGQRQRVAIARALFAGPAVFLADEPTGNLDEETANDVADTMLALPEALGVCVIIATHDRSIADRADRVLVLSHGRIASGPAAR